MTPDMVGSPAMWAQFGALGLVCLMLFLFLGFGARWFLGYVSRREDRYAEETRRRDELFASSLSNVVSSHEKVAAQIVNSLDRLALEVRDSNGYNGTRKG